jgi:hypothetical protein
MWVQNILCPQAELLTLEVHLLELTGEITHNNAAFLPYKNWIFLDTLYVALGIYKRQSWGTGNILKNCQTSSLYHIYYETCTYPKSNLKMKKKNIYIYIEGWTNRTSGFNDLFQCWYCSLNACSYLFWVCLLIFAFILKCPLKIPSHE